MLSSRSRRVSASYFRNFVFGIEDGLVSTVGLLAGIAAAGVTRSYILITGIILILVEAFSMAVGSFLAESSAEEYEVGRPEARLAFWDGVIMFFSYLAAGFLPLAPYLIFSRGTAFWWSIIVSLTALFALGFIGAKISRVGWPGNSLRMLVIGGIAILVGVLVGNFLNQLI